MSGSWQHSIPSSRQNAAESRTVRKEVVIVIDLHATKRAAAEGAGAAGRAEKERGISWERGRGSYKTLEINRFHHFN
jgi:hypothetical protein